MLSCSHENKITRKDANFMKYSKLFSPIKIGSITIKNWFAMAPMGPLGLADANGCWNQRGIDYYVERAKGGTGLIITGVTFLIRLWKNRTRQQFLIHFTSLLILWKQVEKWQSEFMHMEVKSFYSYQEALVVWLFLRM